jgi:hypothetical protein
VMFIESMDGNLGSTITFEITGPGVNVTEDVAGL